MSNVEIAREPNLDAEEIVELLAACNESKHSVEQWQAAVDNSLCVVTARDSGQLVGIGFVSGNIRHVELVDGNVHPDWRKQGIHNRLIEERLKYCQEVGARFVGITWDKNSPWLHDHYERKGFRDIDYAMWHESSLKPTT